MRKAGRSRSASPGRSGTSCWRCGSISTPSWRGCEDAVTTRATTLDVWNGGTCPFEAGWRKVMMWWFIVTDGLLFAGFLASYGYARRLSDAWPDQRVVFSVPYIAA